jgi:hypothetical protein
VVWPIRPKPIIRSFSLPIRLKDSPSSTIPDWTPSGLNAPTCRDVQCGDKFPAAAQWQTGDPVGAVCGDVGYRDTFLPGGV